MNAWPLKKSDSEAMYRQLAGALLIAGAVSLGATNSGNTGGLQVGMVIIGGQVSDRKGLTYRKRPRSIRKSIKELGESFGNEMKTVTIEFRGKAV